MPEIAAKNKKCYISCKRKFKVFVELKKTLSELLQKLYDTTKKEKGITLNISHENKQYNKFSVENIPTRKKKKCSRVGKKYEQKKAASQISVEKTSPKERNVKKVMMLIKTNLS